ncbi:2-hydroxyacid dehydrogenase [Aurantiacibacter odishensis]|uniref:2-hydroxyacid dehydrogenase n=1 Tax=Aurantiacibacter odishensis TaxID=1155476 RepID=UPI000E767F04|nr:2-hydroxyacid dehydrogenase [Aurantiacibacter odishensis]
MAQDKPAAVQLCRFSDYLENALAERLRLFRWFDEDDASRAAFLDGMGKECHLVVTGGHIGCANDLIDSLPSLKLIAINGVGFDKVDLPHASARGVAVSNTPDVLTDDVADLALGLVIALKRGIASGDVHVRAGKWADGELPLGRKVTGSRFGVLGLGRIGHAIADRCAPMGEVGYWSRTAKDVPFHYCSTVHELARWSDVLIVACAATPETQKVVDGALLERLGREGVLVNVARGSVVDEQAVIAALESRQIAGAALDVFEKEPQVPEALRHSENTVLTPHVGSATVETRKAMADLVIANVDAVLAGDPPCTPVA